MKPMSPQTRRHFLRMMAAAAPLGAAAPFALQMATMGSAAAQCAPTDYRALVCIFLFGGNDRVRERSAQQMLRIYKRGQAQLLLRAPFLAFYLDACWLSFHLARIGPG